LVSPRSLESRVRPRLLPGLGFVLALLTLHSQSLAQPAEDPGFEELQRRAERVNREYPWLYQASNGLDVRPRNVDREDFLRGLHAATDVVFDGTSALPERIDLSGLFPSLEGVLEGLVKDRPDLAYDADWRGLRVLFRPLEDSTAGMSETLLISRYRRPKHPAALQPNAVGVFVSGLLVVDGSEVPPPLRTEVYPDPPDLQASLAVNGFPVRDFPYIDPAAVDRALYTAPSPDKFREALLAKADSLWLEVAQFPGPATSDRLRSVADRLRFVYGVRDAVLGEDSIDLALLNGDPLEWSIPREANLPSPNAAVAHRRALAFQNDLLRSLSVGNVVFVSSEYGPKVLANRNAFVNELRQVAGDATVALAKRESEIRRKWPNEADWILEYFYTSLVDPDEGPTSGVDPRPEAGSEDRPETPLNWFIRSPRERILGGGERIDPFSSVTPADRRPGTRGRIPLFDDATVQPPAESLPEAAPDPSTRSNRPPRAERGLDPSSRKTPPAAESEGR